MTYIHDEDLQLSLRGRTFLGFRVVIGTVKLAIKDLAKQYPNVPDGTLISSSSIMDPL